MVTMNQPLALTMLSLHSQAGHIVKEISEPDGIDNNPVCYGQLTLSFLAMKNK